MAARDRLQHTWDDFTGGHWVGGGMNQPDNTWTGIDVQLSPVDHTLVRRAPYRAWVGPTTPKMVSAGTFDEGEARTQPVVFESNTVFTTVDPSTCVAFACNYENAAPPHAATFYCIDFRDGYTSTIATVFPHALGANTVIGNPIVTQFGKAGWVYFPTSDGTTHRVYRYNAQANVPVFTAVTEPIALLARWGQFMVGAARDSSKLYFSADYSTNFSTWPAASYFEVGDGDPITALVVQRDQLWIGKASGWWVMTGVIDDFNSVSIRQVNDDVGPAGGPIGAARLAKRVNAAAATDIGIVFPRQGVPSSNSETGNFAADGSGFGLHAVRGVRSAPVMHRGYESGRLPELPLVQVAGDVFVTGFLWEDFADNGSREWTEDGLSWVLDGDRWARVTVPVIGPGSGIFRRGAWCRDFAMAGHKPGGFAYFLAIGDRGLDGLREVQLWEWPTRPHAASFGQSATVELAPMRSSDPFVLNTLYVEVVASATLHPNQDVDFGEATPGIAEVSASVRMDGVVGLDTFAESTPVSDRIAITDRIGATNIRGKERRMTFKLTPSDAPAGTEMTPVITFSGCRIRKVTAICTRVDWP